MTRIVFVVILLILMIAVAQWFIQRLRQINERMRDEEDAFERDTLRTLAGGLEEGGAGEDLLPQEQTIASRELVTDEMAPAAPPEPAAAASPPEMPASAASAFNPSPFEQRLQMAGLLDGGGAGEDLPIQGTGYYGRLLRLKTMKTLVIVPPEVPEAWIDAALRMYDHVLVAGPGQGKIVRRFEDFLAEQMFR